MAQQDPPENTSSSSTPSENDVLLPHAMPEAEYMYGCTPTALGMLIGYYDLYGYPDGTDLSNLIDGVVALKSRGTDGNAYDMDAFDTVLGRFIASEEYVSRFYRCNGSETTPAQELAYAFVDGGTAIDTSIWNCLADYIGTGQFWRGNANLSTLMDYETLETIANSTNTVTIKDSGVSRTIEHKYTTVLYGLELLAQSKGYHLDYEITGSYATDNRGGTFSFEDYMAEIDAGRPVLISVTNHSMVGYGYNPETREIIFDNCYESGQRIIWGQDYFFSGEFRSLENITVIGFNGTGHTWDLGFATCAGCDESVVLSGARSASVTADYLMPGDKLYLNFAVTNNGDFTSQAFTVSVYLDGVKAQDFTVTGLGVNAVREFRDIELGDATEGHHSVKLVIDEENRIPEKTATNNTAEKEILVIRENATVLSGSNFIGAGSALQDVYIGSGASVYTIGGTVNNADIYSGGNLAVYSGGTAQNTTVQADGHLELRTGGKAVNTVVGRRGGVRVYGGVAENTTIQSGGGMTIWSKGMANSVTINSNGRLTVSNGTANDISIFSGGSVVVRPLCLVNNVTVNSGGTCYVNSEGAASGLIENGGFLSAAPDASVSLIPNTFSGQAFSNGTATVHSGTTALDTLLNGGKMIIFSGGIADLGAVKSGGIVCVSDGGLANSFTVNSGGMVYVSGGGSVTNATVCSGGSMMISKGGKAGNLSAAFFAQIFFGGGTASSVSVESLGYIRVSSGGKVGTLDVLSGGRAHLYTCSVGQANVERGGYLIVSGAAQMNGDLYAAGKVNFENTKDESVTLNMTGHTVCLDVARSNEGDTAFINDLSRLANCSLSVKLSDTQQSGSYKLAQSASSFTGSITVYTETGNKTALSVGASCLVGSLNCSLSVNSGGLLSLAVVNSGTQAETAVPEYVPGTWSQDWVQASRYAKEHNKIILSFYGDWTWCGFSENMIEYLFKTPDFKEISDHFVLLYNTEVPNHNYGGSPYIYLLDADGNSLAYRGGFGRTFHDSWMNWLRCFTGMSSGILTYDSSDRTFTSLGTQINGRIVSSKEQLFICNGGIASLTTVENGNVQVTSGGSMIGTVLNGSRNSVTVQNGAHITDTVVNSSCSVSIKRGGTADRTTINSYGYCQVSSGGTANSTTINGGYLTLQENAVANDIVINSGGLTINNTAMDGVVLNNGYIKLESGGTLTGTVISSGNLYCCDGVVSSTTINGGYFYLSSGGTANGTTINGGHLTVLKNAVANDIVINSGGLTINNTAVVGVVMNGGYLALESGGTLTGTVISSGSLYCCDGVANGTTLNSGFCSVSGGAVMNQTTLNGGYCCVYTDGIINDTLVNANVSVSLRGGAANDTSVASGGICYVYSGGAANNTAVSGQLKIFGNGTASNTTVASGGFLTVSCEGKLTGRLSVEQGASVWLDSGAYFDFDLTQTSAGADALVNDLSGFNNAVIYTMTVDRDQAFGTYRLADNAGLFTSAITVRDVSGTQLGRLSIGKTITLENVDYKLTLNNKQLCVAIREPGADDIAPTITDIKANIAAPTNQPVTVTAVFSDNIKVVSELYRIGEGGDWTPYVDGVTVSENTTVYFKAVDAAANESAIESYSVTNIDRTPPEKPSPFANTAEPTKHFVLVSADFSKDTARMESSLDGLAWSAYTSAVKVTENRTVYFRGFDAAGNVSEIASYDVTNIDKSLPDNRPDADKDDFLYNKNSGWNDANITVSNTITGNGEIKLDEAGSINKDDKHNMFGNDGTNKDPGDVAMVSVETAAKLTFTIDSTAPGTFYVYEKVRKNGKDRQLTVGKVAVKANTPATLKDICLSTTGSYFVAMIAQNVRKAGAEGLYNVNVTESTFFFDADGSGNGTAADARTIAVGRGTESIVLDEGDMTGSDDFANFVGFGDSIDFAKLDLASSACLSFDLESDGAAKFTIWKQDAKGKMTKAGVAASLTAKNGYKATSKALFFDTGKYTYYISVESTDAAKGGNAYYNVKLNAAAVFFDSSDNDLVNGFVYDRKKNSNPRLGEFRTNEIAVSGKTDVLLDNNEIMPNGYGNFVGYADKSDYAKFTLAADGDVTFTIDTTGAGTFAVYRNNEAKKKLEVIGKVEIKADRKTGSVTATGLVAGEDYFISMTAKNTKANDKGSVFYNVTAAMDPADADALAMPEPDALAMPEDALSFGRYDADALAGASAASLAELDGNAVRLNIASLA